MGKVYWTTKEGKKMDVDEMPEEHVRNTLKMLIRQIDRFKEDSTLDKPEPNAYDYLWK